MSGVRVVAACLAVGCAVLLPSTADARRSPSPMVNQINKVRKAHGVSPARYSRSLSVSSSRFSRYLVRTQRFAHGPRIMASARFSKLGEILALMRGSKIRTRETLASWLRSPSHRAVILSPDFRYVGAARTRGRFNGSPALVWAVQFGR